MNQLKVHIQQTIETLHRRGWSGRKIARELELDRGTVSRHLRQVANSAIVVSGSEVVQPDSKPAIVPAGSEQDQDPKPAIVPTGSTEPALGQSEAVRAIQPGRASQCEPWRTQIQAMVQQGQSAQRIYQGPGG